MLLSSRDLSWPSRPGCKMTRVECGSVVCCFFFQMSGSDTQSVVKRRATDPALSRKEVRAALWRVKERLQWKTSEWTIERERCSQETGQR